MGLGREMERGRRGFRGCSAFEGGRLVVAGRRGGRTVVEGFVREWDGRGKGGGLYGLFGHCTLVGGRGEGGVATRWMDGGEGR